MARRIPLSARAFPGLRRATRTALRDLSGLLTTLRPIPAPAPFQAVANEAQIGSAARGTDLLADSFTRYGQTLTAPAAELWITPLPSHRFAEWLHSFDWLSDLAVVDAANARVKARQLTDSWVDEYSRYHAFAWRTDILARRLVAWLSVWSPLLNTDNLSDLAIERRKSAVRQARFLKKNLNRLTPGVDEIRAFVALAMLGARLDGDRGVRWRNFSLERLSAALGTQILPDGSHISRNPQDALETLTLLQSLDSLLEGRGLASPPALSRAMDRLAPMIAFFSHTDGGLSAFHGGGEGDLGEISAIAARLPAKPFAFAPHARFQRLERDGTVIIADVGPPAPFPYDSGAHLSPFSFEMSTEIGRLIVNCGWSPEQPKSWREPVRATSAHSALVLGDRSAGRLAVPDDIANELEGAHVARGAAPVSADRRESDLGILVEGSHHGFVKSSGLIHSRRLFLSEDGRDLRGEDTLELPRGESAVFSEPVPFALRFHLHPDVQPIPVSDGRNVLLRRRDEAGIEDWVFLSGTNPAETSLMLEDSAYLASGLAPQSTQQICLRGQVSPGTTLNLRWAIRRRPDPTYGGSDA